MTDSTDVLQVEEPEDSLPETSFDEIPQALRDACGRAGWSSLMPVQAKSLPYLLSGRDLMVQSRTGSGKTGAFVLPILDKVDPSAKVCQALVLAPTRELARQVAREAEILAGPDGPKVVAVYGGVGYGAQVEALKQGAQIVIGTPGRVLDHLLKRTFTLEHLKFLVFDEADRMLSIGFYPDMKAVQRYLPKRHVGMLMFSATFPPQVLRLAKEFMREPQMLSLSSSSVHVAEVTHAAYEVPRMQKDRGLIRIIELLNPASCFIFCNTKHQVHYLSQVLQNFGYNADELSADLTQAKREQILERLRRGEVRFLVATDVAARGIDIPDLSHVVLYEPPEDPESYIHRAGRTGRAGAVGEAVSLVDTMEAVQLERIARLYKINFEKRPLPTDEDVAAVVTERTTAILEARLRAMKPLALERMRRTMPLAQQLAENAEELPLLAMLLDEIYQQSLHAPPVQPEGQEPRREARRDERRDERREPRHDDRRDARRDDKREARRDRDRGSETAPSAEKAEAPKAVEAAPSEAVAGEAAPKKRRRRRRRKKPGANGAAVNGQQQNGQTQNEQPQVAPSESGQAEAQAAETVKPAAKPSEKREARPAKTQKTESKPETAPKAEVSPEAPAEEAEAKKPARKRPSRAKKTATAAETSKDSEAPESAEAAPAKKPARSRTAKAKTGAEPAAVETAEAQEPAPKTTESKAKPKAAPAKKPSAAAKKTAAPAAKPRNPWEGSAFGGSLDDLDDDE